MKMLLVDDVATNRFMTKALLRKLGFETLEAESCEKALEIYQTEGIDFLIVHWVMPGEMQGIDLIKKIRAMTDSQYSYIILLTSKNRREDIAEGIAAGADDYVVKPFNDGEFGARIKMGVRNLVLKRRICFLEKENSRLKSLVKKLKGEKQKHKPEQNSEKKNGLHNRETILKILKREKNLCNKSSESISIILIKMKRLNDIGKREIIEQASDEIAKRIKTIYPACDLMGWFNNSDLLLILPRIVNYQAKRIALSVRDFLEEEPVKVQNHSSVPIKAEVGISTSSPENPLNIKEMFQLAANRI